MSWLNRILSKCVIPAKKINPSNRPPIKIYLECLEERWCPSTVSGVSSAGGSLGGNANTGITFSNASWSTGVAGGASGFYGTVKNGQLGSLGTSRSAAMTQTYSTSGGLSVGLAGAGGSTLDSTSGRFSGSFTVTGSITLTVNEPGMGNVPVKCEFLGYGEYFGTENTATGNITDGTYLENVAFEPLYATYMGNQVYLADVLQYVGNDGNWSDKNNWVIYGSSVHPSSNSSGQVFIFDGSDNKSVTYDSAAPQPGMVVLQNGYTGIITVPGPYTLNPGFFVDASLNNPNVSANIFDIDFTPGTSGTPGLTFNNAGGPTTFVGSLKASAGGSINIADNVHLGDGSEYYTDSIYSPVSIQLHFPRLSHSRL